MNINTATLEELDRLPGIGSTLANSIVLYRTENGNFKTNTDIMNVPKIGEKKFEALAPFITVGTEEN